MKLTKTQNSISTNFNNSNVTSNTKLGLTTNSLTLKQQLSSNDDTKDKIKRK